MNEYPIGHPENDRTKRAPVDAILLAQTFFRGDEAGAQVILKNSDPHSVALQLCGFLYGTMREFGVDIEERLAIWLKATRGEIGEGDHG